MKPRISVYIAASIDGYIARIDDRLDWLDRVGGFDEDYGFHDFLNSIDAVIIGRKTYEVASTVPEPYPGKRVIVLSNSLKSVQSYAELYQSDLGALVTKLHREGIKHIWVDGGTTISQFLSAHLVDTMTLSFIPVILGNGIPLFHVMNKEIPCRLIASQSYQSGLVQLRYEIIKRFTDRDKLYFKIVDYGSDEYKKSLALREEILRKPHGSTFTHEELMQEKEHVHVAGFFGQELCATAALIPHDREVKLQRVTTKSSFRSKGVGSAMMLFCEAYVKQLGCHSIYCYARENAVPFYLKNQYFSEGESCTEEGFSCQKMKKFI